MKAILILFLSIISFSFCLAQQDDLDAINNTRYQHTLNGMIAFSAWTGANLTAGTIGVLTTKGELQHFFEMNIYFNLINLGIAVPGLISAIKAKRTGLSFEQSVKEVQKVKTLYLVNAALDLTYITAGFLFREVGRNNRHSPQLQNRLRGYGNSFIVQGGFLFLYDLIAFGIHAKNGKRLDAHWSNITVRPYGAYGLGLSVQYQISSNTFSKPFFAF